MRFVLVGFTAIHAVAFAFSPTATKGVSSGLMLQHGTFRSPQLDSSQHHLMHVRRWQAADANDQTDAEKGSVLGASLLFAGTAIGAGMLALPAETAASGFVPSISSLLVCWAFTLATSLVTLEASWTVMRDPTKEGSGFLSITRSTLGPAGEIVTGLLFWFLLSSIVVAYTSEGGELLSEFAQEQLGTSASGTILSPQIGSTAFMAFFASLAIFGTERVDIVNRVLVFGLISAFLGLLGVGLPQIDVSLFSRANWGAIYPEVISAGILSFGAQNVVPTLIQYLGGDAGRTRKAVLIGSLIPLLMYTLWEAVFLGIVPWDPDASGSKMQVVTALGASGGAAVQELVEVFSACAIGSSMAGASVSLVDFFQDFIATEFGGLEGENLSSAEESVIGKRLIAAAMALLPPLGVACTYPGAFLGVLEIVGLLGAVSLYGLLPSLSVINLRDGSSGEVMPGRLPGGALALYAIIAVSAALILPDVVQLVGRGLATW